MNKKEMIEIIEMMLKDHEKDYPKPTAGSWEDGYKCALEVVKFSLKIHREKEKKD